MSGLVQNLTEKCMPCVKVSLSYEGRRKMQNGKLSAVATPRDMREGDCGRSKNEQSAIRSAIRWRLCHL